MLLKQTVHFQVRMMERGISFDHVKQAMKDPDSIEDVLGEKKKAIKDVGDKTIEVVYYREQFKSTEETYLLITAYYK